MSGSGFSRREGYDFVPPVGPIDPAHPECASVVAEVETLLDGECTAETRDRLKQHLEECPTCLDYHGLAVRVKRLVAMKCGGERAPDGLRERLRVQISRTTIVTEERIVTEEN